MFFDVFLLFVLYVNRIWKNKLRNSNNKEKNYNERKEKSII